MKITNALIILLTASLLASCNKAPEQPNIILILADDFGYMDCNAYAQHTLGTDPSEMYYETPNLDRLAREGMAFSRAYANQLCSPTRAAILTGKYAGRVGFTTAMPHRDTYYNQGLEPPEGQYIQDVLFHHDAIPIQQAWINGCSNSALPAGSKWDGGRDETTIAEALPGYHSAFIGKWHVGGFGAEGYQPGDQGFEPIAWFDAGGSAYFNWRPGWNNRSTKHLPNIPQDEWMMGDAGEETGEDYLTDDLTVQALRYLDERAGVKDEPFFLYFCHFAVHSPWHAKKEDSTYFAGKPTLGWNGHRDPRYAGMVRGLDNSVGAILDKLVEKGLDENTLVIFISDNGGWDHRVSRTGDMATSCAPLRGGKACLSEGGIRVPLIFWWKGKLQAGSWSDVTVDCTDLFPTIMEAAGRDPAFFYGEGDIDGRSLLPLLKDPENRTAAYDHDTRYWHYPFNVSVLSPFDGQFLSPRSAIMEDNYKLIFDWHGYLRLFDLENDLKEEYNLAAKKPDKTLELVGKLVSWLEEEVDPQYLPRPNPDYNPEEEVRKDAPFVDLYKAYKNGGDIIALANTD